MTATSTREHGAGRYAALVAAGILLSRIAGLIRQRVFAHYFGNSAAADAFNAAFRIPNFLQNMFGEGVLSASFIPVYARLLGRDDEEARRVAGAVFALLALVTAVLVLAGVLAAPALVDVIAVGFEGERRELAIALVRIFFPGAGLLVLSAWCLGVLNSHRLFFLSYVAPVIWNLAIIVALVAFGGRLGQFELAEAAAWGSVAGSFLQFAVQIPAVIRVAGLIRPALALASAHVRTVVRNFGPVFVGRGVVQISAFVDSLLASLLPIGGVAGLNYAQILYTLPVSLFGMSVSAAELPAMSSAAGGEGDVAAFLRGRLDAGLQRIAFFVVPSAVAFLALGDVVAATVYQSGEFGRDDSIYVWGILAGSSVGLLASTLGRLYASTFYALHDTRTPLRFAIARVATGTALGYLFAIHGPAIVGVEARWGAAGITLASGVAGWIEYTLLRRAVGRRIGPTSIGLGYAARVWGAAVTAAAAAWLAMTALPAAHPIVEGAIVLGAFGAVYFAAAAALGVGAASTLVSRMLRVAGIRR